MVNRFAIEEKEKNMLTIYQNGTILTMTKENEKEETAEAVLVRNGYIQKVGSLQEVEKEANKLRRRTKKKRFSRKNLATILPR